MQYQINYFYGPSGLRKGGFLMMLYGMVELTWLSVKARFMGALSFNSTLNNFQLKKKEFLDEISIIIWRFNGWFCKQILYTLILAKSIVPSEMIWHQSLHDDNSLHCTHALYRKSLCHGQAFCDVTQDGPQPWSKLFGHMGFMKILPLQAEDCMSYTTHLCALAWLSSMQGSIVEIVQHGHLCLNSAGMLNPLIRAIGQTVNKNLNWGSSTRSMY